MRLANQRIKELRIQRGLSQTELAERAGYSSRTSITKIESGERQISEKKLQDIAHALNTTVSYLLGEDTNSNTSGLLSFRFPVLGEVSAGFNSPPGESDIDEYEYIPADWLNKLPPEQFIVLMVKGDSMYPDFKENDRVLVRLMPVVPNNSVAVCIYDSEYASLKQIRYQKGQGVLELVPFNREYPVKTISGPDLDQCRIIGQVWKTIRDNR